MTKWPRRVIIGGVTGSGPNLGDNLGLVILLLVVGIYAGTRLQKLFWQMRRGGSNWRPQRGGKVVPFQPKPDRLPDAADQLRTVMKADFTAQPLLNKSEARLFRAMDKLVIELAPPGWQVMAQVSLGEILQSADKDAYACINSKRVDLLIVDADYKPIHAIEYQGGGHHQGTAAARDTVKKEALRRAGIVEVVAGDTPAELRRVVERLVQGI